MTRPVALPAPTVDPTDPTRYVAWAHRYVARVATWSDALQAAVAQQSRYTPDAHITATPSHVTPSGALSVRVFVRRHGPGLCRCEETETDDA